MGRFTPSRPRAPGKPAAHLVDLKDLFLPEKELEWS